MLFLFVLALAAAIWHCRRIAVVSVAFYAPRCRLRTSARALRFWLAALAAACVAYACENPTIGYSARTPRPQTVNLAILLDMSGSMDASDWPADSPVPASPTPEQLPPSRVATAKAQIRRLIEQCPGTRAALLAFAQNSVLVSPLATTPDILLERLDTIQTEHFQDGTATGQAIAAATRALKCAPYGPKAIVLLSDGVDHTTTETAPETAAETARQSGIVIHAVGIGGRHALHPVNGDDGIRWEAVGEPLDMAQLQAIAQATGGTAFQAKDADGVAQAIHAIQRDIHSQAADFPSPQILHLAPVLLAAAAILLALSCLSRPQTRGKSASD